MKIHSFLIQVLMDDYNLASNLFYKKLVMQNKLQTYPVQLKPSDYADELSIKFVGKKINSTRKKKGQFFTSPQIARYMASLSNRRTEKIKILDCGCGTAILACALVEELIKSKKVSSIEITAYEKDSKLTSLAEKALDFLQEWVKQNYKVKIIYEVINKDFITEYNLLFKEKKKYELFDIAISNPPYYKLRNWNYETDDFNNIVYGQPNIYMLFLAVAMRLLKNTGELIFIIPRSFTSGVYFKFFRGHFFSSIQIKNIHIFKSRRDIFLRDKVLQENIIIHGKKINLNGNNPEVQITSSHGVKDLSRPQKLITKLKNIVDLSSNSKILHIPLSETDIKIYRIMKRWKGNFDKFDITISTGPIVAFRNKENIINKNGHPNDFPLIWLHNVRKMKFEWPESKPNKGQYIKSGPHDKTLLVPNKNYVLVRRFSSKDDKSRLIATPFYKDVLNYTVIGLENHINYIYKKDTELGKVEITGLAALLNSRIYDRYFRLFNGNTNVSVTELKQLPLPDYSLIIRIGRKILKDHTFSEHYLNEVVENILKIKA